MPLNNDDKNWIIGAVSKIVKHEVVEVEKRLDQKLANIPTLDQFNDFKDSVLGAINKHESELLIVSARLARLEERIEVLELKK